MKNRPRYSLFVLALLITTTNFGLTGELTALTLSAPVISNSDLQLNLTGPTNLNHTLQFSADLKNWETIFSATTPDGSNIVSIPLLTNQTGFYRAYESGVALGLSTVSFTAPEYSAGLTNTNVTVAITLLRAGDLGSDLYLNYDTADGTALAGVDYTPVFGMLHFSPAQTNASIVITLMATNDYPGSSETFDLNLTTTNNSAQVTLPITINYPPVVGIWAGTWTDTHTGLPTMAYDGGGSGTWQLQIYSVNWSTDAALGVLEWGEGSQIYSCDTNVLLNCGCIDGQPVNTELFSFPVTLNVTNVYYSGLLDYGLSNYFNVQISCDLAPFSGSVLSYGYVAFNFNTFNGTVGGPIDMANDANRCAQFFSTGFITGWRVTP